MSTNRVNDFPGAREFLAARIELAELELEACKRAWAESPSVEATQRLDAARARLDELKQPERLSEVATSMAWTFARDRLAHAG